MESESRNAPAFPVSPILPDVREGADGLTKREWIATHALMGILAQGDYSLPASAVEAVHAADAFIAALKEMK